MRMIIPLVLAACLAAMYLDPGINPLRSVTIPQMALLIMLFVTACLVSALRRDEAAEAEARS